MEEPVKNTEKELLYSVRGRMKIYKDGSADFRPESGERRLYETVGTPVKDGNLQMSANSYKVQALVSRKCTDPAAELRQKVNQLLEPLDKAVETERLERATLIGSTPHANVYATKDKIQVVFTVSRNEPNPDLASIDPKIAKKNGIKLTLNPDETIVKEIVPVCSIINSNSQTLRSKSTPKKTTVK